jgi:hypothetical protein
MNAFKFWPAWQAQAGLSVTRKLKVQADHSIESGSHKLAPMVPARGEELSAR